MKAYGMRVLCATILSLVLTGNAYANNNRVRFINQTSDVVNARLILVHFEPNLKVWIDAQQNGQDFKAGNFTYGDRAIVIYDKQSKKVIAQDSLYWDSTTPKIFILISGDSNNGYTISPGADP